MRPKFSIGADERLHLSAEFVSNGHWLLTRKFAQAVAASQGGAMRNALNKILSVQLGSYPMGLSLPESRTETPEMRQLLPKDLDGLEELHKAPIRAEVNQSGEVYAYVYQSKNVTTGIGPKYVPLLDLASKVYAKDKGSALVLVDNDGTIVGVIMPVRLGFTKASDAANSRAAS